MINGFINPYHFLPLESKKTIETAAPDEAKYSGYIQAQIKNRTAMIIPNPNADDIDRNKVLNFFTYYEEYANPNGTGENIAYKNHPPVIPGSAIRGMLRSIYEMATNSCMSVLNKDAVVSRRISDPGTPGLLHKNGGTMELYTEVTTVGKIKPDSVKDRTECSIYSAQGKKGILVKGEAFMGKHCHVFFPPDDPEAAAKISISDADMKRFEQVLELYADSSVNKKIATGHSGYKEYTKCYKKFKKSVQGALEYFPVYYSKLDLKKPGGSGKKTVYYITPAQISREVYEAQPMSIVKDTYAPCQSLSELCPACRLFGMVGSSEALASKVRITDGAFVDAAGEVKDGRYDTLYNAQPKVLEELASPKPGNMEFYFKQPMGADFWTLDYYSKDGVLYQNSKSELMGRKFYWHHGEERLPEGVEKTKRNSKVRLLKRNKTFSCRVYFEDITKTELQRLIYLCNISGEQTEDGTARYGYHLGLGKPLGLGSIEMEVEDVRIRRWISGSETLRIQPMMQEYANVFHNTWQEDATYENGDFKGDKKPLLRMLEFNAAGDTLITYPIADGQSEKIMEEGFKFFVNNKYQLKREDSKTFKYENGSVLARKKIVIQQSLKPFANTGQMPILKVNKEKVYYTSAGNFRNVEDDKKRDDVGKNSKRKGDKDKRKGNQRETFTGTVKNVNGAGYTIGLDENPKLKYKTGFISGNHLANKGITLSKGNKISVNIYKENEQRKNYTLDFVSKF